MPPPAGPRRGPDASRSLAQYARRASRYDRELALFEPVREEAIALLDVRPGATVLDVGCGTGLSFSLLHARVGAQGRIVGIEPSPEMLAQARARIAHEGLPGISLVQSSAATARLPGQADAALFHFTHDVLQDPEAVAHVLAHLKPGAHVVASGLQWAPFWLGATNLFVLGASLYSVTCMAGLERPWELLAESLRNVEVRTRGLGGIYVASGRVPGEAPGHAARRIK
jgi:ubiquinone/menaquinone biosynthesis C-methylase UbiE